MPESPSFRVQRDVPWLRQTADRVGGVLVQAFPPLQGHPHASVRAAVTHGEFDCDLGSHVHMLLRASRLPFAGQHGVHQVHEWMVFQSLMTRSFPARSRSRPAGQLQRGAAAAGDGHAAGLPAVGGAG
jgi:hypothetical protein